MIFVDTNVFMYAVGRKHPLREQARDFFIDAVIAKFPLCTSTEVLQELLHAYLPVGRISTLDAALKLALDTTVRIYPVELEDIQLARVLVNGFPGLGARDLLHLACYKRHDLKTIKTFDRALDAAANAG